MSKKTQKKSPKTPSSRAAKTAAKKSIAGASRGGAKASTGKSVKKPATASHAAASKTLKASASKKPLAKGPLKKTTVERPPAANPAARKQQPPAAGSSLSEGARAPAFALPADGGKQVALADYLGQKLVIFFYPRADTPGCTREAIDFTRLSGAFADAGTAVLGVSADPLSAQEAFRDKHRLSMALASDETHGMLESYSVWGEKSMYGKIFLGILRTTVLVDRHGKIARIWRNVKVDGHADEVLAAAQAL